MRAYAKHTCAHCDTLPALVARVDGDWRPLCPSHYRELRRRLGKVETRPVVLPDTWGVSAQMRHDAVVAANE